MKSSIKPAIVGATLLDSLPIHAAMFEVQFTGSVSHVEAQSNFSPSVLPCTRIFFANELRSLRTAGARNMIWLRMLALRAITR